MVCFAVPGGYCVGLWLASQFLDLRCRVWVVHALVSFEVLGMIRFVMSDFVNCASMFATRYLCSMCRDGCANHVLFEHVCALFLKVALVEVCLAFLVGRRGFFTVRIS